MHENVQCLEIWLFISNLVLFLYIPLYNFAESAVLRLRKKHIHIEQYFKVYIPEIKLCSSMYFWKLDIFCLKIITICTAIFMFQSCTFVYNAFCRSKMHEDGTLRIKMSISSTLLMINSGIIYHCKAKGVYFVKNKVK